MAKGRDDSPIDRADERKAQRARELQAIIERLTRELTQLEVRLTETADQNDRIMIKAEIVHFTMALDRLHRGHYPSRRRKPPGAGLPVPAIPPGGPLPKQGGAATPLEFDR